MRVRTSSRPAEVSRKQIQHLSLSQNLTTTNLLSSFINGALYSKQISRMLPISIIVAAQFRVGYCRWNYEDFVEKCGGLARLVQIYYYYLSIF
jgi:hypothetical protein